MIRLLSAELARLRARRVVWIAAIAAVALLGAFQIGINSEVTPPSTADLAQVERAYQEAHQEWADHHVEEEADCRESGGSTQDCTYPEPSRSDYGLEPTSYAEAAKLSLQIGTIVSWLALVLIGATAIGAEFTTGAIGNWLTFVPRRGRVLASKLLAVAVTALLIGAVLSALALAVPAVLVMIHGGAVKLPSTLVFQAARGVGLGLVVAFVGFAVALITRHTVGAIGAALGYLVALFVRIAMLGSVGWAQRLTPWTPEGNLIAVFNHDYSYEIPTMTRNPDGIQTMDFATRTLTWEQGLAYTLVGLAVVIVLTAVVFSRRDVT